MPPACAGARTPLSRSWSARSVEAREVLVRFQRAGRESHRTQRSDAPTVIHNTRCRPGGTTKPAVHGDRPVRHTDHDGLDTRSRLHSVLLVAGNSSAARTLRAPRIDAAASSVGAEGKAHHRTPSHRIVAALTPGL